MVRMLMLSHEILLCAVDTVFVLVSKTTWTHSYVPFAAVTVEHRLMALVLPSKHRIVISYSFAKPSRQLVTRTEIHVFLRWFSVPV